MPSAAGSPIQTGIAGGRSLRWPQSRVRDHCASKQGKDGFRRGPPHASRFAPWCSWITDGSANRMSAWRTGINNGRLKISRKTNDLRRQPDHDCVLFVQHPSKNAPKRGSPRGSFVACAGTFGNSDAATEGGIPKSSRVFNSSLYVPRVPRVCPKAR